MLGTCRYCHRTIRSRKRGEWDLAEGLDLDNLAATAGPSHFCVIDIAEGLILERTVIRDEEDEDSLARQRAELEERHHIAPEGGTVMIRLVHSDAAPGSNH